MENIDRVAEAINSILGIRLRPSHGGASDLHHASLQKN